LSASGSGSKRKNSLVINGKLNKQLQYNKNVNLNDVTKHNINLFKSRVQFFLMQVVINKCFLLNPEKKLAQICLVVVFAKNPHFNSKKMTSPSRTLGYSNNQLKSC